MLFVGIKLVLYLVLITQSMYWGKKLLKKRQVKEFVYIYACKTQTDWCIGKVMSCIKQHTCRYVYVIRLVEKD
jgi:hypothetical protein